MSEFIRGNDRIEVMLQRQGERAYKKGTNMAQQDVPDVVTEKPYTPTTEAVKANYSYGEQIALGETVAECDAQFNRWLAEVKADSFAQGRDSQRDYAEHVERERIIALIEREWEGEAMATNAGCEWLIELIKGEEQ